MYLCKEGDLLDYVTEKMTTDHLFQSKYKCDRHVNCPAIPFPWPVEEIFADWNRGVFSPLLLEATRCFCGNPATGFCMYGGHMTCHRHLESSLQTRRTRSPFLCPCKRSPVWPNPFHAMHSAGELLHNGEQSKLVTFKDHIVSVDSKMNVDLKIKSWLYPLDPFPNLFHVKGRNKMTVYAWRVAVEVVPVPGFTNLRRCHWFWTAAFPKQTLHAIDKMTSTGRLISHPTDMFMFFYFADETIQCLCCKTRSGVRSFAESGCSLYPLSTVLALINHGSLLGGRDP